MGGFGDPLPPGVVDPRRDRRPDSRPGLGRCRPDRPYRPAPTLTPTSSAQSATGGRPITASPRPEPNSSARRRPSAGGHGGPARLNGPSSPSGRRAGCSRCRRVAYGAGTVRGCRYGLLAAKTPPVTGSDPTARSRATPRAPFRSLASPRRPSRQPFRPAPSGGGPALAGTGPEYPARVSPKGHRFGPAGRVGKKNRHLTGLRVIILAVSRELGNKPASPDAPARSPPPDPP